MVRKSGSKFGISRTGNTLKRPSYKYHDYELAPVAMAELAVCSASYDCSRGDTKYHVDAASCVYSLHNAKRWKDPLGMFENIDICKIVICECNGYYRGAWDENANHFVKNIVQVDVEYDKPCYIVLIRYYGKNEYEWIRELIRHVDIPVVEMGKTALAPYKQCSSCKCCNRANGTKSVKKCKGIRNKQVARDEYEATLKYS